MGDSNMYNRPQVSEERDSGVGSYKIIFILSNKTGIVSFRLRCLNVLVFVVYCAAKMWRFI